jgi:hypothetical protein
MSLLHHPFIALPCKFVARIAMAAIWGVALSSAALDVRLIFGAGLAVVALFCSRAFWAWDKVPFSASRFALYGLYVAGEAMAIGAFVLAFLGAYTGQLHTFAMITCAFGGSVLTLYPLAVLYRDNMSQGPGSTH